MWTLWFGQLGFLQPFLRDGNKGKKGWAWKCDIISQTVSGSEYCWPSVRYAASEWEQMGHLGLSRSQQKAWACKASRWAWSSLCRTWATMPCTSLRFWTRWIVHSVGQYSFLIPGMWFGGNLQIHNQQLYLRVSAMSTEYFLLPYNIFKSVTKLNDPFFSN